MSNSFWAAGQPWRLRSRTALPQRHLLAPHGCFLRFVHTRCTTTGTHPPRRARDRRGSQVARPGLCKRWRARFALPRTAGSNETSAQGHLGLRNQFVVWARLEAAALERRFHQRHPLGHRTAIAEQAPERRLRPCQRKWRIMRGLPHVQRLSEGALRLRDPAARVQGLAETVEREAAIARLGVARRLEGVQRGAVCPFRLLGTLPREAGDRPERSASTPDSRSASAASPEWRCSREASLRLRRRSLGADRVAQNEERQCHLRIVRTQAFVLYRRISRLQCFGVGVLPCKKQSARKVAHARQRSRVLDAERSLEDLGRVTHQRNRLVLPGPVWTARLRPLFQTLPHPTERRHAWLSRAPHDKTVRRP